MDKLDPLSVAGFILLLSTAAIIACLGLWFMAGVVAGVAAVGAVSVVVGERHG